MISAADIAENLTASTVLDRHGIKFQRRGSELRTKHCPACGERSRDAVSVNASSGMWCCHRCGERGDVLRLVALLHGLDVARDFPRVVEVAAELAGITGSVSADELRITAETRARQRREAEAAERSAKRERGLRDAAAYWATLDRRNPAGAAYLSARGIDPEPLLSRDVVRFATCGDVAVRLRAFDGAMVNVARRVIDPTARAKVEVLPGCPTDGTLAGSVTELDRDGADVAVIVEGLTDTLAAVLAWPGCVVLGANGAGKLGAIGRAAAVVLAASVGWLLVVPDVDDAGERGAAAAVEAAMGAGLAVDSSIHLVDVRPHKDLSDAWCSGWRWRWPS